MMDWWDRNIFWFITKGALMQLENSDNPPYLAPRDDIQPVMPELYYQTVADLGDPFE